jgi:hypothetical protein
MLASTRSRPESPVRQRSLPKYSHCSPRKRRRKNSQTEFAVGSDSAWQMNFRPWPSRTRMNARLWPSKTRMNCRLSRRNCFRPWASTGLGIETSYPGRYRLAPARCPGRSRWFRGAPGRESVRFSCNPRREQERIRPRIELPQIGISVPFRFPFARLRSRPDSSKTVLCLVHQLLSNRRVRCVVRISPRISRGKPATHLVSAIFMPFAQSN